MAIMWDNELPDRLVGSTETMKFTLDDTGEWSDSKTYDTIGTTVDISGTITSPAGYDWNVEVSSSQGWRKEYDDIPTGEKLSFDIKTNFGSTKVHIHIWSVNGAADTGLSGELQIDC
jgi:hypothetical protein